MNTEFGNKQNFKRVTGEALFKATGDSGWQNLGDVIMHKFTPEIVKKAAKRHVRGGRTEIVREDITEMSPIFVVTLQEHMLETVALLLFATQLPDYVQAAGNGLAGQIANAQPRRAYEVGSLNLSDVEVRVGATLYAADVDYRLDAQAGMLYVMESGAIPAGSTLAVVYSQPALTMDCVQPLTWLQRSGTFLILESDNQASDFRTIYTFPCDVTVDNWGKFGVDDFNTFDLRVVATGAINTKLRKLPLVVDAQTLVNELGDPLVTDKGDPIEAN